MGSWRGLAVVVGDGEVCICSSLRHMTRNAELVSLSVSEVSTVVILVIFKPQAGRTFRYAAMSKCDLVRTSDQRAILS